MASWLMKRKRRYQILMIAVGCLAWMGSLVWSNQSDVETDDFQSTWSKLRDMRESISAETDQTEIFSKGYVALLVGWALLHNVGKTSVRDLVDAVYDGELPSLAVFVAAERSHLNDSLPEQIGRMEVTKNPENYKIWKLIEPKNCKDILPLYINTRTGSFICGDTGTTNLDLWRKGLPHLPFSVFSGPALAMDPLETWTGKQWLKFVFQGVSR